MDCSISHVVSHNSTALVTLHDEIKGEVLNEEDAVVPESPTEQGVQHAVSGSIGDSAASVGLTALTPVLGLATECSLINLTLLGS